ncbi:FUSC family protein, partial [Staphylococcus aureus]|nr:FUSC family protein [Staphylococcus aureus]
TIDEQLMGTYLVVFENIAKHFELQENLTIKTLSDLPQYNYIQTALMHIQESSIEVNEK